MSSHHTEKHFLRSDH